MNKKIYGLFLALIMIFFAGCTGGDSQSHSDEISSSVPSSITSEESESTLESVAKTTLDSMTLRQKVGQMFIVRVDSLDFSKTAEEINDPYSPGITALNDILKENLSQYPVGGFIIRGKNIDNPDQLSALNKELCENSHSAPFIATDEEGGAVARLANSKNFNLPKYKSAADVGSSGKYEDGYNMGNTIGRYLNKYGFNVDFAPVADVNTNKDNPVIGSRAFSSDATIVGMMSRAFADGLINNKITPTFKHFPGHGDTLQDSHIETAVSYKTLNELRECEFIPFLSAGEKEFIMVGHIALPNVTGDNTPATMSKKLVTDILKGELHFKGLVITDSMAMDAIDKNYTPEEAAVNSLYAGCDIILEPAETAAAFDGIVSQVENGNIKEADLDEKVLRILEFKENMGILK
jgi:beta-N-acetylhexosaminidase